MVNQLKQIEEFKKILADYHISEHGRGILDGLPLIILAAPSSTGRNTIINELLKTNRYHFIISNTTRKPRVNDGKLEENGVEYWFKTEEEMLDDLKRGEMLEAEIIHNQQVSGISIKELENAKNEGRIAITDIEIGGFNHVLREKPDTIAVVLLPPSFDVWQSQLVNRGPMLDEERKRRLTTALQIFQETMDNPGLILIVNHDLHKTVEIFKNLDETIPDQREAHRVAKELLEETKNYLRNKKITS